jgi:hypothetical protein
MAKHRPICGIYAAAMISQKPVDEVFEDYKKTWNKGNNWKGKTKLHNILTLITKYGISFKEINVDRQRLSSLIEDVSNIKKTMLIRTTGHIQLLTGEYITDQTGTFHIKDFWGKNKIVNTVIIIG